MDHSAKDLRITGTARSRKLLAEKSFPCAWDRFDDRGCCDQSVRVHNDHARSVRSFHCFEVVVQEELELVHLVERSYDSHDIFMVDPEFLRPYTTERHAELNLTA